MGRCCFSARAYITALLHASTSANSHASASALETSCCSVKEVRAAAAAGRTSSRWQGIANEQAELAGPAETVEL